MRLIRFLIPVLLITAAHADTVFKQVTFDMGSAFLVDPPGPFSLAFEFADGSGTGDGNNVVTLSNFQFGLGGGSAGSPLISGSVSGDLSTAVVLTDAGFDNIFIEGFTPGTVLQFNLSVTTNVDPGGIPDEFIVSILDSSFSPLPTTSSSQLFPFLVLDIDSSDPSVQTFGTDGTPAAAGGFAVLNAPVVTSFSPTPEPSAGWVCGVSLTCLIALRRRIRKSIR